ncbi:MAG: hypothetical protein ACOCV1_07335, partial [Bacillota bacterium]
QKLNKIISLNNLGILFDRLVINQFIRDLKMTSLKTKFIIPVSLASLNSKKEINYLLKRLDILNKEQIIFKLDFETYLELNQEIKDYLKDKQIKLCFENILKDLDFNNLNYICKAKYIILNNYEYNHNYYYLLKEEFTNKNIQIIYNHKQEKLIKSDLLQKAISYIIGDYAGKISDLKKFN